jgi:protein-S-isoprenylcysteine O-methyltransferase
LRPLVFHQLAAGVAFGLVVLAYSARELQIQVRQQGGGRDPSYYAMLIGPTVAIPAAILASGEEPVLPGPRWLPFAVGMALMVAGMAYRNWAVHVLGRFFTVGLEEGHTVVDDGPYRHLRHPSYTGMLAFFAGFGIALDSWWSVAAATLPVLVALVIRIRHEERMLRRELGRPYLDYSERTSRLIPGVW